MESMAGFAALRAEMTEICAGPVFVLPQLEMEKAFVR
jgi:hypothetical protein